MDRQKIRETIKKTYKDIMKKSNVNLVGCGYKVKNGVRTNELSVIVGVAKKMPLAMLSEKDTIPSQLNGINTDVIETQKIVAFAKKKKTKPQENVTDIINIQETPFEVEIDPTVRHRPAMPGISIGHKNITAGTFGCVVKKNGTSYILSNNHVLANSNNAEIGDEIYQPGPYDGGTSADLIGHLHEFVPIMFGGGTDQPPVKPPTCSIAKSIAGIFNFAAKMLNRQHRLIPTSASSQESNQVDAALAEPIEPISDEIIKIGKPTGIAIPQIGLSLQKYGRTTKYTTGEVIMTDAVVSVQYGAGQIAEFSGQIIAGPMSQGGDSGSAVLDMQNNLVGLLFAGSDSTTIINPIQDVFDALGVSI